jgi:ectoine hydroxylase-related dioxygenase (phytanoyl-CoA dioxygenase family)
MTYPYITDDDVAAFARDGFVIKRAFFDAEEIGNVTEAMRLDPSIKQKAFALDDGRSGATDIVVWNHPGNDIFGAVARCERIVRGSERLLGGEVYHYHSKITMKRPGGGGTWNWHQDYGYWYKNYILSPDLLSVAIAVTPQTVANGCLQVLKGSHLLGRIEHPMVGGQTSADPDRMAHILERLETVVCEMAPGDAIFFHANTLHTSTPNTSAEHRHLLLCCYNRASNNPYREHHHPSYTKLEILPDSAIRQMGAKIDPEARSYMDPSTDKTIVAEESTLSTAK